MFDEKYKFSGMLEPTDRLLRWSGSLWYHAKDVPDLWAAEAIKQTSRGDGTRVAILLPAKIHATWWYRYVVGKAASIYLLKSLVDGVHSAVVVWDGLAHSQRPTITWYIDWKHL
jgi:hypothetical protein